ncbi:ABC transporter ATP-binding protein [Haliangium ochraceum]|uniref:ABC transporter related protein n=1 Tax=Haliangium ochraceum (strain DSM 14365 / JCM 11303 / SMP-2) TaxID=502025 RepID=D0LWP0_HALO1|nr:ATP-binding cassette domain-containing protein [Haliangium ochraceum]ACY17690.1 ABC transporter related protein [Haliangium ochraceum DSM 14365]
MIQLQNVSKSYDGGKTYAVREIDLEVAEGELLALLGTSGCGKTTTLKMLNRLVEPTAGTIRIDGRDTAGVDPVELRRSIGYVFQGIGLFPHLSIAANVAAVPRLLGWSQSDIDKRVDELLDLVGLPASKYARRMPHELSGGQRQRVGVARALAARPQVMLMDEPFGALDPVTRDSMQKELTELRKRLGITIVLVTHDMTEALLLADRIAVMSGGKIERLGTPSELLRNPGSDIVESFVQTPLNQANLIEELAGRRVEPKGEPSAEQGGAA